MLKKRLEKRQQEEIGWLLAMCKMKSRFKVTMASTSSSLVDILEHGARFKGAKVHKKAEGKFGTLPSVAEITARWWTGCINNQSIFQVWITNLRRTDPH
ncbi:hypothetical protein PoB_006691900 [Plakobranchus ocellatus]|uniref:Uncharacterized protein n=1 Tax=Plakobranchus ocellatus TaxID=259542 RepID=A0AAV4D8A1_9GAST|nr:hypothetical protein PoB_006691900 [Plakobranchus ocellatus]